MTTTGSDPRGGLFIDTGDGRGPIHTDDLSDADRAAHGLALAVEIAAEAPAHLPALTSTEDHDDGR